MGQVYTDKIAMIIKFNAVVSNLVHVFSVNMKKASTGLKLITATNL